MKTQWLNLVLALTNQIYQRKQKIVSGVGLGIIGNIISLFFLEAFLALVSLPLYIGLKPDNVTAYLSEKGSYEKITFDYHLRRVLTLTGLGVILFIWIIKLLLIILVPNVYGPLQLYQITDLRQADVAEQNSAATETRAQTARILDSMIRPELSGVEKNRQGDHIFFGSGQPQTTIVLLVSDKQTVALTDKTDSQGRWRITQLEKQFKLSEGNHSIAVFGYDEKLDARSHVSATQYFKVKTSFLDQLAKRADIFINLSILILVIVGILLTILTL